MAEAAWKQVYVNVLTAGLLLLTLFATAYAAWAAARAARASVYAVRIMRNADRPYLTPFEPILENWAKAIITKNDYELMEVRLDITNIGMGVGFIAAYGIAHEICPYGAHGSKELTIRDGFARLPLHPDGKLETSAPFDVFQIAADERAALIQYERTLYIYGYVRYYDFFGIYRRTGFMFEFVPVRDQPEKSTFIMTPNPGWWYDVEEPPEKKS
jgi:hypothetical protein